MARNAEKAMTALSRWRKLKMQETNVMTVKRPYLASECHDLHKAETWRRQIIRDIAKKVSQIQNPGLGEFRTRDLNDEINKLLREKRHWEVRIKELGGRDYLSSSQSVKILNREGKEIPSNPGYKYFGAARDLPGVRELLAPAQSQQAIKKTKAELMRHIDAHYYGYLDEDDGLLLPEEYIAQRNYRQKLVAEWEKNNAGPEHKDKTVEEFEKELESDPNYFDFADDIHFSDEVMEIKIPSQEDVENAILEKKKQDLLRQIDAQYS